MKSAWAVAGLMLFGVSAGCALGPEKSPEVSYSVVFPSENAAVYTENLEVFAFENYACSDAIQGRLNGAFAVSPAASVQSASVCKLLASPQTMTLPFSKVSLLVVGTRPGQSPQDVLIGCAEATVGDGAFPLPVNLSVVPRGSSTLIPVGACPSLAAKCSGGC